MATYADGKTEAMVGDVVKCVKDSDYPPHYDLRRDCTYVVEDDPCTTGLHVTIGGVNYCASRFELIKRTGAAPSPAKAEPLVKWPEEKRLTWPKLEVGEWFAFDREGIDDAACLRVADGYVAMFSAGTSNAILPESRDYRVRRLRMIQPPKFEVI